MNAAEALLQSWAADARPRDYKARHAHRGTPSRLRLSASGPSRGEKRRAARERLIMVIGLEREAEAAVRKAFTR
jgi:hypothetical protein